MDIVDTKTRSRMMSGIGGKDTKPELLLRRGLHARGFRFRLHDKRLPGKPDLVLSKFKAAIFVHGCFWHRHEGCRYATTPSTRPEFWSEKFATNVERDARNEAAVRDLGWRIAIVWECSLKRPVREAAINDVVFWLRGPSTRAEF
tara:strand:+ start:5669 stop:6103 length:435 start_codon:yes stop_codon:yes gene_type:complete